MGKWKEFYDRLHYRVFRGWVHDRMFSDQDKVIIETTVAGPERLSKSDTGVIAWRKFAGTHARRPAEEARIGREVA
jgi:hypothetical protein